MLSETPKAGPNGHLQLHASTVVINGKAVAIMGPTGSGKTAMAFKLLSLGATLLADDITWIAVAPVGLIASCPPALSGQIEARGIGILNAVPAAPAPLHLVVDLGVVEHDRVPKSKTVTLLGQTVTLLHTPEIPHFSNAIMQYLMHDLVK